MPKFPTYERQVGLAGGSTASYASDSAFTAPARAMSNAGNALADLGGDFLAIEQKVRQTQDDTWVSKARADTALAMDGNERAAQNEATDGANGYTDRVRGTFDTFRKTKLGEAPSQRAARMYQEWSDGYDVDLTRRSASFQASSELAQRTSDFADAMNKHAQLIYADPTQYDVVAARAKADLDAAKAWMTPEQEIAAREKIDHDLKLSRAKSMVDFKPADFVDEVGIQDAASVTGGKAVDVVVDRIIGAESGGNPNAKNPNSSASGVGQFTDSTWLATVRKHRPDLAGQSNADILAKKNDASLGREMTTALTQDNAKDLSSAGLPVTAGNLYLAHFAGIGGAKALLRAGDGQTVASVLGPEVMKANGFLNGMSVADIKAWSAKKMGGKTGPLNVGSDPRYAGLSVDEIRSLSTQAETAVNAQNATAYASLKDSLEQGIATGSVMTEAQIVNSGLNGGDVATLLGKYRSAQDDGMSVASTLEALAGQSWSGDAFAAKDRKSIDGAATAVKAKATPEQYQAFTEETVRQSGIVPQDVVNELRRGLQSRNAQEVAAAAQRASRISSIDPAALGRRDGGSGIQDDATAFDHYVNNVGLSQEEAAKRLMDKNDPEKVKARASLMESKPIKDFIKDTANESTVRDIFDPGAFGFDPSLGETPAQAAAMVGEYSSILSESIFDANGDTDLAETLAAQRFQKRYGVSSMTLSGPGVVTRLPPEVAYPPGPDGTHDYVMAQAKQALAGEGVSADEVFLQADTMTEDDVKSGKPARYQVFYKQNGQLERYMLPFYAIPGEAPPADLSGSQGRMMENRDQLLKGRDRERSLDVFLDGNPLTGEPN